jgi:hypothetical protein
LLDEDPPLPDDDSDGSETIATGGGDGNATLAYEGRFSSEPQGERSPYDRTQEMKPIPRVPRQDDGVTTLPLDVHVDEATTPRARPHVDPVLPAPAGRPTPAPTQVERALPEAPPRPPPSIPPPPPSGFFDDPRLTPPVLVAVAVVAVATMAVLGWLAAWALRS